MTDAAQAFAAHLADWNPGPQTDDAVLTPEPARALRAVLELADDPLADGSLPALWHWLYFLKWPARSQLGPDGHLTAADFLPPLPDRRRMFAGGRLQVRAPLRLDEPATRISELTRNEVKSGGTGAFLLTTVRTEISQHDQVAIVEEQDIVYRSGPATAPPAGQPSDVPPVWSADWHFDEVLLFRFSALTANPHRIHYDRDFARGHDGFANLVVHGPLLALLMAELVRVNAPAPIIGFEFRLRRPLVVTEAANVRSDGAGLTPAVAVVGPDDTVRASATATLGLAAADIEGA